MCRILHKNELKKKEIVVFIGLEKKNVRYVFPQDFVAETVWRTGQLDSD